MNRELARDALNERDGASRTDGNYDGLPNYYPNSVLFYRPDLYEIVDRSFAFSVREVFEERHLDSIDLHYRHARATYFSLNDEQRTGLHENLAFALSSVKREDILRRFLVHLNRITPTYNEHVRYELSKYDVII